MTPIARVPNIQSSTVLQYLDRGIQGIIGPHISTRADAEQLVRACYFGPLGERSFGGNRGCDYDFELTDKAAELLKQIDDPDVALHKQLIGHLTRKELRELSRLLVKARESLLDEEEAA